MATDKIESYVGFAIKSGKITYGNELISRLRSDVFVVLVSADAAKNTMKVAVGCSEKFSCPMVLCENLGKTVNRPQCKIAVIRDQNLATAIRENVRENICNGYTMYTGGADGEQSDKHRKSE